jgi:2-keto-3-deoxy-L-rhamnonate aldolase RhmA
MAHLAHVCLGYGVAPMVWVRSAIDPDIPVLLDAGVTGVVVPDTETAEQAAAVVRACKFPPVGNRSLGGLDIHYDYGPVPAAELIPRLNRTVLVVCMIETVAGLDQAEAIAGVPGLDGVYLGGNDMLASRGKAGRYDDPAICEALDRIVAPRTRTGCSPAAAG